jgi:hypothetical protein
LGVQLSNLATNHPGRARGSNACNGCHSGRRTRSDKRCAGAGRCPGRDVRQRCPNGACIPLAGAQVDVWHCDALGVYSGVTDTAEGFATVGEDFLRGYQISHANGVAAFSTIYPGWYRGRAVHIHFKIRTPAGADQVYQFTSQLFFDDAFSDQVYIQEPYAGKGQRDQSNSTDGIYQQSGGQLLLTPVTAGGGYAATFDIALDLSDTEAGQADGGQGGPGDPGGAPPRGTRPPGG